MTAPSPSHGHGACHRAILRSIIGQTGDASHRACVNGTALGACARWASWPPLLLQGCRSLGGRRWNMAYRTILVGLDDSDSVTERAAFALALAERMEARLIGILANPPPFMPTALGEG